MSTYVQIKSHSHRKYRILGKYLGACEKFSNKYQNFAYIDTHGGSGKVLDVTTGKLDDGSIIRAAKIKPNFPCYVVEIDRLRCTLLRDSVENYPNVTVFYGDCNTFIDDILNKLPKGEKFVFCFIDPDGLVYRRENGFVCPQLVWKTVDKIANFPRTEVLINLPLEAIMRETGYIRSDPDAPASRKMEETLTVFYGTDKWKQIEPGNYREFLSLYISERLENYYPFKGAILVREEESRGPLYYLVFGSKYSLGGKIMRDIMRKEFYGATKPLVEQPPTRFVYED